MNKFYLLFFAFLFLSLFNGKAQTTSTYSTAATYTWTCPTGVTSVTVECFGAGGCGSARTNSGQNAGGGGGAYASSVIAVTAGTNYTVVVGAGGTSGGTNNGGNSTFNTNVVVAAGGTGLANGVAVGGAGGLASASTGTIKFNGGTGGAPGGGTSGGGGGGAGSSGVGGAGNIPSVGTGGAGATDNIDGSGGTGVSGNSVGGSGNGYGGGGAGGSRSTSGSRNGGNGADGAVLITYVCPVVAGGSYTVGGASPNYATLTAAFAAINCGGLAGDVNLVLQTGYTSASETFPIATPTNTGTYSVTVYPGVSGLSITSANTAETINFDGSDNIIFDGRVNQAGALDLIIENTSTGGVAIQFIDDATYNTIKYCTV
ncbi:MAG TPA: hypothetical protein VN698_10520, partial [Bacteroidia bacterium]|nr:hypothetical protein [Bacteroidia bacterium]